MSGKDWHLSRSKPKLLLLLMKTNFYLVDLTCSNCVPTFSYSVNLYRCIYNTLAPLKNCVKIEF